ncbi:2922_t:CDS:2, partial [Diversispora eburnea]
NTTTQLIAGISGGEKKQRDNNENFEKPLTKIKTTSNKFPNSSQYFEYRSKIINEYRLTQKPNPYPHKFHVDYSIPAFIEKFNYLKSDQSLLNDELISIAGRIHNQRSSGSKLIFYDLQGEGESIQIVARAQDAEYDFTKVHEIFHRGDVVGVKGYPGRTKSGQLSIYPKEIILLSPCLHQLPTPQQGFKDQESRYRQRYLDLIMNKDVREKFIIRTKIINYIRKFLNNLGFLEVETPMMTFIASGATAKPFVTHLADFKRDIFMRIAPELYLKQLVIGGLDRVYEIGRQFRNESIDMTHNPEFTSCEFYMTYNDVYDLMNITENLLSDMVKEIIGKPIIKYQRNYNNNNNNKREESDNRDNDDKDFNDENEIEIDFTPPFKRFDQPINF